MNLAAPRYSSCIHRTIKAAASRRFDDVSKLKESSTSLISRHAEGTCTDDKPSRICLHASRGANALLSEFRNYWGAPGLALLVVSTAVCAFRRGQTKKYCLEKAQALGIVFKAGDPSSAVHLRFADIQVGGPDFSECDTPTRTQKLFSAFWCMQRSPLRREAPIPNLIR